MFVKKLTRYRIMLCPRLAVNSRMPKTAFTMCLFRAVKAYVPKDFAREAVTTKAHVPKDVAREAVTSDFLHRAVKTHLPKEVAIDRLC